MDTNFELIKAMPEASMSDKLDKAYCLAESICYEDDMRKVRDTSALFGEEVSTLLWAYTDGLLHTFHNNRVQGRCSLKASLEYDMEKQEKIIEGHLQQFISLKQGLVSHAGSHPVVADQAAVSCPC